MSKWIWLFVLLIVITLLVAAIYLVVIPYNSYLNCISQYSSVLPSEIVQTICKKTFS